MNLLSAVTTAARGLTSRAGTVITIFVVAVVAVAAGAAAPAYYAAGKRSILADSLAAARVLGRGMEVTQSGPVSSSLDSLTAAVSADLGRSSGLFSPPVESREGTAVYPGGAETLSLVWRSGLCAHLAVQGSCPSRAGQFLASRDLARANGWRVGQAVSFPSWGRLTLVGLYVAPRAGGDYWFDRLGTYFPVEFPVAGPAGGGGSQPNYDALFTAASTLTGAPASTQGSIVVDQSLAPARVAPGDAASLAAAVERVVSDPTLAADQAVAQSDIPATVAAVRSQWTSLSVPVIVVSLELLALAWLLLFVLFGDAAESRGPDIALAKLRGYSRWRTTAFALSEPLLLLVVSYPAGMLAGWALTGVIGGAVLRPGTAVGLPGAAWVTAAAAAAGGVAAVLAAGRRTRRRDVMAQWRHSGNPASRGWVIDTLLVTAAAGGLVELEASGALNSADRPLTLLFPGLLGLAVAVLASRLLPLGCALLAAGNRKGVVGFLALRQVARRPGGSRTTTILAASFTLATFAVSAWAVSTQNYRRVAGLQLGAPVVLDVTTPAGADLAAEVARADPAGRSATPVEEYSSGGSVTLAVDPSRWNAVAAWRGGALPAATVAALDPPEAPPLVVRGDRLRVHLSVGGLTPAESTVTFDFLLPGGVAVTPVQLPALPSSGAVTDTVDLPPCPCTLSDIAVSAPPAASSAAVDLHGTVTVGEVDVHGRHGWRALPAAALSAPRWYADAAGGPSAPPTGPGGSLRWDLSGVGSAQAKLWYRDRPFPALPAVAAAAVTGDRTGPSTTTGLDGRPLPVDVVAAVPSLPGAPGNGVVVDIAYAQTAAAGNLATAQQQVWAVPGSAARLAARLRAEGVRVDSVRTASQLRAALARSGPGLAETLFLAEAAAAAVLASGGSVLALYVFARRRRYELAALASVGVTRTSLLRAVVSEQLIVLGYGAAVGTATGLVAVLIALRDLPEFAVRPAGIPLATFPPGAALAGALAAAVAVVLLIAAGASTLLVRGVAATQLREAPQ